MNYSYNEHSCTNFCKVICSFLWKNIQKPNCCIIRKICLPILETASFLTQPYHFTSPTAVYKSSHCSLNLHILVISLFNFCCYIATTHVVKFCPSDNYWHSTPFYILINHLNIFFRKVIHVILLNDFFERFLTLALVYFMSEFF